MIDGSSLILASHPAAWLMLYRKSWEERHLAHNTWQLMTCLKQDHYSSNLVTFDFTSITQSTDAKPQRIYVKLNAKHGAQET
ncbi:hypothetical protein E2C01_027754 [Portunus trituberculatus]|uniref:Uncharacterized protein n=1 Tax=Portunus trituberculatus TaxID=210409 RepID=A0A5B7EM11_PORTR|nr:hypothetical protein [Portunus trituberculatus]